MKGIMNVLDFLNENWTTLLIIIGICISIVKQTVSFYKKDKSERILIAKNQIREILLKLVDSAEKDFADWNKAGAIKRSQVITEVFEKYPILSKAVSQDDVIAWLDEEIDKSLAKLKEVAESNKD